VDAAVTGLAGGGEVKLRRAAIETLGQRRVAAATPLLLTAAAEADESIRLAALRALGDTAGPQDVAALVALLVGAKTPGEIGTAEGALRAACGRLPDRDPAAQALAAGLPQAGAEQKAVILRVLGQVSGAKALEAVRAAIKEANEGVRDTAVRVLSEWPDAAAIPDLAVLAKASESRKYQILALRGYIRLIGQSDLPADKKLAMCKEAMGLAQRDEEKKLALGVLGGVPSPEALAMVAAFLDSPSMKDEAAAAAVAVGDKIAGSQPKQVAEAMKKVLRVTANKDLQKRAEEVLGRAGGK
jgi:HEAT repeat protein